ncbi:MAG: 1-(5-phosphoribosyl)-5-[(5-phosphoribosylamino)methylideneamino] imidazole-4-carboxamide isomerase [Acidobacteria bacterium]|nr:1-(5-phosphoribosyl)-5-[(5-phosphoribosylamino)methylideneamino] imidazole-4-carboxamide isomerase [Acidobacteriota bacterium]
MILPCIDLMSGKAVQLVGGRRKALEVDDPLSLLGRFAGFREFQIIDLDAALSQGDNDSLVQELCARVSCRVGGGVRSVDRGRQLLEAGARKVIVGSAAFSSQGVRHPFLSELSEALGPERIILALDSEGGRIVVQGWRKQLPYGAVEILRSLESYCREFLYTCVDQEGQMQGTDLQILRSLRQHTRHDITAAGGISTLEEIQQLNELGIHAALGMALYTGKLPVSELLKLA